MFRTAEFTESLLTPHPMQGKPDIAQPLGYVIEPEAIAKDLAQFSEQELPAAQRAAADYIALQVRSALWFPQEEQADNGRNDFTELEVSNPPTLEDLRRKQVAACTGFTLVTSVFLDEAEIDHYIGFANGHWLIALDTDAQDRFDLLDPLAPEVSQNAWRALIRSPLEHLREDIEEHGRGAVMLNGFRIRQAIRPVKNDRGTTYPWLNSQSASLNMGAEKIADKVIVGLFPSEEGQEVLEEYSYFRDATINHDLDAAVVALHSIGSRFPNMDARSKHPELKWIVAGLASTERVAEAKELISSYFKTFSFIGDSRFIEAEGDTLKLLARASNDPKVAEAAIEKYERASKMPRSYSRAIEGKIGKLSQRLGVMATTVKA